MMFYCFFAPPSHYLPKVNSYQEDPLSTSHSILKLPQHSGVGLSPTLPQQLIFSELNPGL